MVVYEHLSGILRPKWGANTKMDRFTFQTAIHGVGGFAKVIRGKDNILDRDIAVKVLNELATEFGPEDRERFKREAKILAKLSHPNIPAIYDIHLSDEQFFIIFQFVEGRTLRQILSDEGAVPIGVARKWFHQIASALEHAHGNGVIHRDIKPDNIIVTPDRESAYLVDFGIALSAEDGKKLTRSGYFIGTMGYMSPEQHAGEPVDRRTDIYSLGITLYEVLAGRPLRPGPYEALSTLNETIPPQIDDLVSGCLEDLRARIESAKTFSTQLEGALQLPTKPLSEILAHGRLHEVVLSVEALRGEDIAALPAGQRDLLVLKVADVVASNDPNLQYPAGRFLELMITRGVFLPPEDYRDIIAPALTWGFDLKFQDDRQGRLAIREALEIAAFEARGEDYKVFVDEFTKFLKRVVLTEKQNWYLQGIREIITSLMANMSCGDSPDLKQAIREVNRITRDRR
jgi:predicted Ser/Thr protein kinase